MRWKKLGRIFCPDGSSDWMHTHAMIPIPEHISGDLFKIYFTPRDKDNRGHGAYLVIDITDPLNILELSETPVLEPGELGCFDDRGALPNSIAFRGDEKLLFYTGINIGWPTKLKNSIGLAKWDEEKQTFVRCFKGPLVDRDRNNPHFVAMPEVMFDDGLFKMWFLSCAKWEMENGEPKHYYRIEYATSEDAVVWNRNNNIAINFKDEHEYAMACPRVLKSEDGIYRMFFCSRATEDEDTYRLRYAESADGISWVRKDDEIGIDVSDEGWDSEMICYPFVFSHGEKTFLLYNGNEYGKTGFGIAVLEEK